jgi:hypothetical protein
VKPLAHPITNPAIKRIRIKAWFRAVTEASGLSSRQLEAQFSPSSRASQRSCIWDKYRRGETAPRQILVELVEERYAGTQQWLYSPLWRLADHAIADMEVIRDVYENLPKLIRSIFVEPHATRASMFWSQIESHLWESANILRGPVDAADFKTYIFPAAVLQANLRCLGRGIRRDRR